MSETTFCERCGAVLSIGSFPFCRGNQADHVGGSSGIEDVTWPGGKTFENLADQPQTFYSTSEYRRYLRTHHLEEFVRCAGPDDRHVRPWATMDAQTLANAAALVGRRDYIERLDVTTTDAPGYVTERIEGIHAD